MRTFSTKFHFSSRSILWLCKFSMSGFSAILWKRCKHCLSAKLMELARSRFEIWNRITHILPFNYHNFPLYNVIFLIISSRIISARMQRKVILSALIDTLWISLINCRDCCIGLMFVRYFFRGGLIGISFYWKKNHKNLRNSIHDARIYFAPAFVKVSKSLESALMIITSLIADLEPLINNLFIDV